jgi:hypothetical protein
VSARSSKLSRVKADRDHAEQIVTSALGRKRHHAVEAEFCRHGIAVARDPIGIEDPLIEAAEQAGAGDQPADHAADIASLGEVADQVEGEQQKKPTWTPRTTWLGE